MENKQAEREAAKERAAAEERRAKAERIAAQERAAADRALEERKIQLAHELVLNELGVKARQLASSSNNGGSVSVPTSGEKKCTYLKIWFPALLWGG